MTPTRKNSHATGALWGNLGVALFGMLLCAGGFYVLVFQSRKPDGTHETSMLYIASGMVVMGVYAVFGNRRSRELSNIGIAVIQRTPLRNSKAFQRIVETNADQR